MTKLEEYRLRKEKEEKMREKRSKYKGMAAIIFMAVIVIAGILCYLCFAGAWSYYNGGPDCVLEQETKQHLGAVSSQTHMADDYKNLTIVCGNGAVNAYNSKGECKWSVNVSVSDPILDVCENYVLVGDRKGKKVYLIKKGDIVLEYENKYNVTNVSVNKKGSFVTVTDEEKYKNLVCVRDKSGKELFTWHSANAYVVDAAISSDSSTVMLTTLDTHILSNGTRQHNSKVRVFDVKKAKELSNIEYKDETAAIVFYAKKGFVVVSDKSIVKYNDEGKESARYNLGGKCGQIAYDKPYLAVVYVDDKYNNHLVLLDEKLSVKASRDFENQTIDALDMQSGVVSFIIDDEIYMCKQNLNIRYRIKTDTKYDVIKLYSRGKRAFVGNESEAEIIVTK